MATRVITEIVDDIDGSVASRTVSFAVEGAQYEIDLSDENIEKLRAAVTPFIDKARRVSGKKSTGRSRSGNLGTIREWAGSNGFEISPRGRIPHRVVEAYEASRARASR